MKTKVGVIGLGLMGNPMAKNILKAGFPVTVYNRTSSKTAELKKLGALVAKSPAELAKHVDVVITMVTAPKDVKQILIGKDGIVKGKHNGLIVIDMSTIGRKAAMQFGAHLEKRGIDFLDAPVTGGTPGAINGELVIYVGGKESVFNKVKPVLGAMGKSLHYIGPTGSGQAVKLINNHLIAAGIMALSEGMILADTMKLSRPKALKALESAPIISQQMIRVMPNYISGEFPVKFTIANLKKDLSLALSEMDDKKKILKLLGVTESLYKKAVKDGKASEDYSAVIKSIK
jgi:3-hydroxyisobutyrate dehydrogenase